MTGIKFIFDLVHKVNFRPGSSYIDSPDWIKKKKSTINPKNADDEFF